MRVDKHNLLPEKSVGIHADVSDPVRESALLKLMNDLLDAMEEVTARSHCNRSWLRVPYRRP